MVLPAVIIAVTVILDQVTKILAQNNLSNGTNIVVIPHILGFSYVRNEGAAFGIFADKRWIFMIFSTVAILVMIYFLLKKKNEHLLFVISVSMLVGGGIGNMIDRIFRGYVIDFFKFLFMKFAVFNVADCFVTIGAVLLAVYLLFFYEETKPNNSLVTENDMSHNVDPSDESFSGSEESKK